jgi:Family of unknown function (DUF6390)
LGQVESLKESKAKYSGELLHAKHAFPPNNLGYCGPDLRGKIEEYLHGSSSGEKLLPYLSKFEAAYPFVKLIARSTGMSPFDRKVTEAYWLGNSLLNQVDVAEFYQFAEDELVSSRKMVGKKDSMKREERKRLFRDLGSLAKPHHTFYVLNMYAKASENTSTKEKLIELMDCCRISWGKVIAVREKILEVERPALSANGNDDQLALKAPKRMEVGYDPEIRPFDSIGKEDWVSIHWNFASDKLNSIQLRNLMKYTALDIVATNLSAKVAPLFSQSA